MLLTLSEGYAETFSVVFSATSWFYYHRCRSLIKLFFTHCPLKQKTNEHYSHQLPCNFCITFAKLNPPRVYSVNILLPVSSAKVDTKKTYLGIAKIQFSLLLDHSDVDGIATHSAWHFFMSNHTCKQYCDYYLFCFLRR